jgi:hypothetical protein
MPKEESADATTYSGSRGECHWLTGIEQYMDDFVRLCSDAILGRYLDVDGWRLVVRMGGLRAPR